MAYAWYRSEPLAGFSGHAASGTGAPMKFWITSTRSTPASTPDCRDALSGRALSASSIRSMLENRFQEKERKAMAAGSTRKG